MRAYCLIRDQPWYRRQVFVSGLKANGYEVQLRQPPDRIERDMVLLIWNRYADNHQLASRVEKGGGRVLVAENGYIGKGGGTPKFEVHPRGPQPGDYYALGVGFHNDSTRVPSLPERFSALNVPLKPWRTEGQYILLCPNRSFGVPERAMPTDWAEKTAARLRRWYNLPVRIRPHPGNNAPIRPLYKDLEGARAVGIWSSSCGVHALAEGIPVFCDAPYWILKGASVTASEILLAPEALPDRLPHFEKMAGGQWQCQEIERGEPFRHLLPAAW